MLNIVIGIVLALLWSTMFLTFFALYLSSKVLKIETMLPPAESRRSWWWRLWGWPFAIITCWRKGHQLRPRIARYDHVICTHCTRCDGTFWISDAEMEKIYNAARDHALRQMFGDSLRHVDDDDDGDPEGAELLH